MYFKQMYVSFAAGLTLCLKHNLINRPAQILLVARNDFSLSFFKIKTLLAREKLNTANIIKNFCVATGFLYHNAMIIINIACLKDAK